MINVNVSIMINVIIVMIIKINVIIMINVIMIMINSIVMIMINAIMINTNNQCCYTISLQSSTSTTPSQPTPKEKVQHWIQARGQLTMPYKHSIELS